MEGTQTHVLPSTCALSSHYSPVSEPIVREQIIVIVTFVSIPLCLSIARAGKVSSQYAAAAAAAAASYQRNYTNRINTKYYLM